MIAILSLLAIVAVLAVARQASYRLRCGAVLLDLYGVALVNMFYFGLDFTSYTCLVGFVLFTPDEIKELLATIAQMGYKMTQIINSLLLLASVGAWREVPIQPIDFEQIMLDLDLRLAQAVASSHATVSRPTTWPPALGYPPWVEEVLANYLSNAIKYGGQPPQSTIGAEPTSEGQVQIWAADNGPGLSAEEQAQLFTPFTRLQVRRADSHGLGLSIVQRIVLKLGGSVGVISQPGQGSRFCFTLPAF